MSENVVILSFSTREHGNCSQIAQFVKSHHKQANVRIYTIRGEDFSPCGDCNYECLAMKKNCPNLTRMQEEIMRAVIESQLTYFIVPNYCGFPCGNYFAFNERSVGYFNMDRVRMNQYLAVPKRFVIVSNTEGDNFTNAMKQQTRTEPDILYMKTGKYKKRSTDGDIMESDAAQADLKTFLEATIGL